MEITSQMVLHTTKFHSELLYFFTNFCCVSCPVCKIIGKVNRYPRCSDMSTLTPEFIQRKCKSSMKLHNLSKIFLTAVATDQNSQKIVSRIDTAPSFLLWRIRVSIRVRASIRTSVKVSIRVRPSVCPSSNRFRSIVIASCEKVRTNKFSIRFPPISQTTTAD